MKVYIISGNYQFEGSEPVIFKAKSIPLHFKVSEEVKQLFPDILK